MIGCCVMTECLRLFVGGYRYTGIYGCRNVPGFPLGLDLDSSSRSVDGTIRRRRRKG